MTTNVLSSVGMCVYLVGVRTAVCGVEMGAEC